MSRKKGFSKFETMTPTLRLPAARPRASRLGSYLSSSTAFNTRTRRALPTPPLLFSTRETVAVDPPARCATCSWVMAIRNPARRLLTVLAGAQIPGKERDHVVLETDRDGAGMSAGIDLEGIGNAVTVEDIVQLARIHA